MADPGGATSTDELPPEPVEPLEPVEPRTPWLTATQVAGLAAVGAGAIHAAAIGIHAEHVTLSRLFVAVAVAQLTIGLIVLLRGGRPNLAMNVLINGAAVTVWAVTRVAGISFVEGLEQAENPQFADTVCAGLGAVAAGASLVALLRGRTSPTGTRLGIPAVAIGALTVAAMMYGASHVHSHDVGEAESAAGDHAHAAGEPEHDHAAAPAVDPPLTPAATAPAPDHAHDADADHAHPAATEPSSGASTSTTVAAAAAWPRPFDPNEPIDFSGVEGVTPEQQARAEALVVATMRDLPAFADVATLPALGYRSIGDSSTGFEHYINYGYIADEAFLDPTKPESLVYRVDGDARTLVSAMFIARQRPIDDPELVDYGGPLMQWHVHENLCWAVGDDGPKVVGVLDDAGNCPPGSVNAGGDNPMVHVWITPHECGPFAALEGHGAGQTDPATGARTDQCDHAHDAAGDHGHDEAAPEPKPYDPTQPIDLSGVEGVTPEQQAYAENLVARTVVDLLQWADPAVAEAAGFRSIGDAATGHEHYINWDWINDDVWLDPDAPESLVYEPRPDGGKQLVSAMYMLPDTMTLEQVPDFGGRLMQWHIHDNLCFTDDPEAPLVRGLTNPDGTCSPPLVKLSQSPMIHVWITPNECGPFAALEGLGAGTPPPGEERWCDHVHGG
jgi:hypothetical protein